MQMFPKFENIFEKINKEKKLILYSFKKPSRGVSERLSRHALLKNQSLNKMRNDCRIKNLKTYYFNFYDIQILKLMISINSQKLKL